MLSDGCTVLPVGQYKDNRLPLLDLTTELAVATTFHFRGDTANEAIELATGVRLIADSVGVSGSLTAYPMGPAVVELLGA